MSPSLNRPPRRTRPLVVAVLLSLTLSVLLTRAADDATAAASAEVAPARPAVLFALSSSYVALQTGVQGLFDQAAKHLVQLYSDFEGPRISSN